MRPQEPQQIDELASPRRIGQSVGKFGENPHRGHQVAAEALNVRYGALVSMIGSVEQGQEKERIGEQGRHRFGVP
jgi:hypothetical protein